MRQKNTVASSKTAQLPTQQSIQWPSYTVFWATESLTIFFGLLIHLICYIIILRGDDFSRQCLWKQFAHRGWPSRNYQVALSAISRQETIVTVCSPGVKNEWEVVSNTCSTMW